MVHFFKISAWADMVTVDELWCDSAQGSKILWKRTFLVKPSLLTKSPRGSILVYLVFVGKRNVLLIEPRNQIALKTGRPFGHFIKSSIVSRGDTTANMSGIHARCQ